MYLKLCDSLLNGWKIELHTPQGFKQTFIQSTKYMTDTVRQLSSKQMKQMFDELQTSAVEAWL